jgi:putative uncharacterized protein FNV2137
MFLYLDFYFILLGTLLFLFTNVVHKTIFNRQYLGITIEDEKVSELYGRAYINFTARTSIIIIDTLILSFFKIEIKNILISSFISSFLIVWPAIIFFKLYNIFNFLKFKIIIRYIFYIIVNVLTSYCTIKYLKSAFLGEYIFILDNSAVSFIFTIIPILIPGIIEKMISKVFYTYTDKPFIEKFYEEINITLENIDLIKYKIFNLYKYEIKKFSQRNNINPKIVLYILCIESLYRGNFFERISEKIYCYFFYDLAIKKDISIGISQIKLSVISNILEQSPYVFKKKLFNPRFLIKITCKIIKEETLNFKKTKTKDIYTYLASIYNGNYNNISVKVYAATLRTLMGKNKIIGYKEYNEYEILYN